MKQRTSASCPAVKAVCKTLQDGAKQDAQHYCYGSLVFGGAYAWRWCLSGPSAFAPHWYNTKRTPKSLHTTVQNCHTSSLHTNGNLLMFLLLLLLFLFCSGLLFAAGAAAWSLPLLFISFAAICLPWRAVEFVKHKWVSSFVTTSAFCQPTGSSLFSRRAATQEL